MKFIPTFLLDGGYHQLELESHAGGKPQFVNLGSLSLNRGNLVTLFVSLVLMNFHCILNVQVLAYDGAISVRYKYMNIE